MACIKNLVLFGIILLRKFGNCGLAQAPFDPCLFIGEKVIQMCYLDDLIFWARNKKDIVNQAVQLCTVEVYLEQEGHCKYK